MDDRRCWAGSLLQRQVTLAMGCGVLGFTLDDHAEDAGVVDPAAQRDFLGDQRDFSSPGTSWVTLNVGEIASSSRRA